ncbi:hypothetical protein [uncultured Desulfobacter sp.]|uniref:hypothetical protein n=1 Tax=uncultured Desulfobacter sp. TaxID=240139 RepID=UPI002AAA7443|nr:hypothetical protein [uncultured Desulfobacter sp.]
MNPDKIIDGLSQQLAAELKAMTKAKDVAEKEAYSRVVKNLCDSLGVFFSLMSDMMPYDYDDEEDDGPF